MHTDGYVMPNDSKFALFGQWGVVWVRIEATWRFGDFVVMVILEIKITGFSCLPSSEGCDSLLNHLDLALEPNKTNERVKKQWIIRQHDRSWRTVTWLTTFRICTFSLMRWPLGMKIGWIRGSGQLLNPSTLLRDTKLDCQKLKHCLSDYYFVESSLSTKIMS